MSEFRYQYDRNRREYIEEGHMELGPTYVAPVKKLLSDVGTRFDHINDLIDYLDEGLIAVTHSLERYANENDLSRKKRLESSLTFVGIYRDQLANVVGQKWNFNKVLDDCVPELDVLKNIRLARKAASAAPTPEQKSLPQGDDPHGECV